MHRLRTATRRRETQRSRARPARRRHLRDDAADDAAGGRPGRRAAAAAVLRHRRPRRLRRPAGGALPAAGACAPRPAARASAAARGLARSARWSAFRCCSRLALRHVDAMHAAVITGVLPLATAAGRGDRLAPAAVGGLLGLRRARLRPGARLRRLEGQRLAGPRRRLLLLGSVRQRRDRLRRRRAAVGADAGRARDLLGAGAQPAADAAGRARCPGRRSRRAPRPGAASPTSRVFSMWLGFFAWYRGLALGGTVRVSQVQLVQPFLSMLFAVPLLGERLDAAHRRLRAGRRRHRASSAGRCRSAGRLQHRVRKLLHDEAHMSPSPWSLARARRADEPVGDPRDPEAHRAARDHLARRRPAVARHLSGRGDARRDRAGAARHAARGAAVRGERRLRRRCANGSPPSCAATACAVDASQVLITTGSQQGLDLVGKVLIEPAAGSRSSRPPTSARCRPSRPTSRVRRRRLRRRRAAARGRWRAAAAAPASSTCCRTSRTRAAAASARRGARRSSPRRSGIGLPLVEDNPYGDLWFDARRRAPLASRWPEGTVYLGSFSKVLAPGLRLGYLVAPPSAVPKLLQAKQAADLHTPSFNQRVVHEVISDGFLRRRTCRRSARATRRSATRCRRRSRATCRGPAPAAGRCRAAACSSGSSCPQASTPMALLPQAVARGVAFVPGAPFFADAPRANTLRLSFVTGRARARSSAASPRSARGCWRRLRVRGVAMSRLAFTQVDVFTEHAAARQPARRRARRRRPRRRSACRRSRAGPT